MRIVFTYLPTRLKEITEVYLKYSIKSLNIQGEVPIIYSDIDYFKNLDLIYDWVELSLPDRYRKPTIWSYPKLKVLSEIEFPFIHLDNDLVVEDIKKLLDIIKKDKLNLCYKHPLSSSQIEHFTELHKLYSNTSLDYTELNNTSIIASRNFRNVNKAYSEVLDVIESNYDFFNKRYHGIPPITLNQQYLNLYFDDINYLYKHNPSFDELSMNGVCHIADKNKVSHFIRNKNLI